MHTATRAYSRAIGPLHACSDTVSSRRLLTGAAVLLLMSCVTAAANASDIVRIEEDWRIEIGTPNPAEHAPQIITAISPLGHLDGPHAVFELNHSTFPDFTAGGMQLQRWHGETNLDFRNFPSSNRLATENEVIEFTTVMEITDDDVVIEIRNGISKTWSSFGGQGYLKVRFTNLSLGNLNAYQPDLSVKNSRVGFASHRVKKLVLKEVRRYSSEELESREETDRIVHQHAEE